MRLEIIAYAEPGVVHKTKCPSRHLVVPVCIFW